MAKRIEQNTFDDAVRENMEEFEMDVEEAIENAVKEFESMGINLNNVIKDPALFTSKNDDGNQQQHPVLEAVSNLSAYQSSTDHTTEDLLKSLTKLKTECDIDLPHRCLAGSNNAYPILIQLFETYSGDAIAFAAVIEALCSLCNGQPDLLQEKHIPLFCGKLEQCDNNADLAQLLVKLIRLTCVMHEANRQAYVAEGLVPTLISTLENYKSSGEVTKECCIALRTLTMDDDIRAAFGKAHEHAKMIVTEGNALEKIMKICQDYSTDVSVLGELFATLSCLAVRNEFCQQIMDLGGVSMMLKVLENNTDSQLLTKRVMSVLKAIAGNDEVKRVIINDGGGELLLAATRKHHMQAMVCETSCATIATLCLRNPTHSKRIMEAGGAEVITKCMQLHPTNSKVQKQACMAVRNLVARNREYCDTFLQLGVEGYINTAMSTHKECGDEAKAALRDLGCKVELNCPWKGTGNTLSQ